MSAWYDCAEAQARADGIAAATTAVLRGELVVLPTDTVYGLGADAFNAAAVQARTARVLMARRSAGGRSRERWRAVR